VDPFNQVRSAGELLAQQTMERVIDLVVQALDVNELVQQVDMDALLSRVDVNALLGKVDVNSVLRQVDLDALLERVDINRLITRVDMDAITRQTDISAVITMSSGSVTKEAVDIVRGQAVALDRWIDYWVRRLLRRKGRELMSPPTLLNVGART
jgi:hypothetical protein